MLGLILSFACLASSQTPAPTLDLAHAQLLDLTYSFDDKTLYWPTADRFKWIKDQWGPTRGGYLYASANHAASENGGTHLDSPLHFAAGHEGTDEIPVSRLIAPAVVLDVTAGENTMPTIWSAPRTLQMGNRARPYSLGRDRIDENRLGKVLPRPETLSGHGRARSRGCREATFPWEQCEQCTNRICLPLISPTLFKICDFSLRLQFFSGTLQSRARSKLPGASFITLTRPVIVAEQLGGALWYREFR